MHCPYRYQGHSEIVNYICWEANGDYLASVSQNLLKIWSLATGDCIQELGSNGNQFYSCVFHPSYSTLLVIGGNSVSTRIPFLMASLIKETRKTITIIFSKTSIQVLSNAEPQN